MTLVVVVSICVSGNDHCCIPPLVPIAVLVDAMAVIVVVEQSVVVFVVSIIFLIAVEHDLIMMVLIECCFSDFVVVVSSRRSMEMMTVISQKHKVVSTTENIHSQNEYLSSTAVDANASGTLIGVSE